MPRTPSGQPRPTDIGKIYEGLGKAGLAGFKIASLHLVPTSAATPAAASDDACHTVELPNGHLVIVCS